MNILRHPLFWILLAGSVLRILSIQPVHSDGLTSDEAEYIRLAQTVSEGNEFIDSNGEYSTRSPLFPFWLSIMFRIFGNGITLPLLLNCLLGVTVIFLTYLLSEEVFSSQTEAYIAAGIAAVVPGLVTYSALLQSETLFLVFFLAAMLYAFKTIKSPIPSNLILFGVFCGLAALTRVVFLGFFPVLLILIWYARREKRERIVRPLIVVAVTFVMVLAPWTVRNYSVHQRFVPISSGGGNSLLTGNNPFATGTWRSEPGFSEWLKDQTAERGIADIDALPEVDRSSLAGRIAFDYMMNNPVDVLRLMIKKAHVLLVYPVTGIEASTAAQGLAVIFDYFFYVISAIGLVPVWKQRKKIMPLLGVVVYVIALHLILHAESRFRLPVVLMCCLFAGFGATVLFQKERLHEFVRENKTVVSVSFAVITAVYAYTAWLHLQGIV